MEYRKLVDDVAASVVRKMTAVLGAAGAVLDEQWLDTEAAAAYMRRSECWVRRHKTELRARKKGDGVKGRLFFAKSALAEYINGN